MGSRGGGDATNELEALAELRTELRRLLDEMAFLGTAPKFVNSVVGVDFKAAVAEYERTLIRAALRVAKGRQNRAAELLRLNPSTLCLKIHTLGIDLDEI